MVTSPAGLLRGGFYLAKLSATTKKGHSEIYVFLSIFVSVVMSVEAAELASITR